MGHSRAEALNLPVVHHGFFSLACEKSSTPNREVPSPWPQNRAKSQVPHDKCVTWAKTNTLC